MISLQTNFLKNIIEELKLEFQEQKESLYQKD
jgi:hypothetical protein